MKRKAPRESAAKMLADGHPHAQMLCLSPNRDRVPKTPECPSSKGSPEPRRSPRLIQSTITTTLTPLSALKTPDWKKKEGDGSEHIPSPSAKKSESIRVENDCKKKRHADPCKDSDSNTPPEGSDPNVVADSHKAPNSVRTSLLNRFEESSVIQVSRFYGKPAPLVIRCRTNGSRNIKNEVLARNSSKEKRERFNRKKRVMSKKVKKKVPNVKIVKSAENKVVEDAAAEDVDQGHPGKKFFTRTRPTTRTITLWKHRFTVQKPVETEKRCESPKLEGILPSHGEKPITSCEEGGTLLDKSEVRATDEPSIPETEDNTPVNNEGNVTNGLMWSTTSPTCGKVEDRASTKHDEVKAKLFRGRRTRTRDKMVQLVIDAGQKDFGEKQCPSCGMIYMTRDPQDEMTHSQFHDRTIHNLRYVPRKNERVMEEFHDGRIILIKHGDPKSATKKLEEVSFVMNNELGFKDLNKAVTDFQAYLFVVDDERKVVGCLVAEPISKGYRLLGDSNASSRALCRSTTSELAVCGINRVWTLASHRRTKVATRLLDCARRNFIYGCVLYPDQVAFSDPTADGCKLASNYFGTSHFLSYG